MYLEKIKSPADVKVLPIEALETLASETRQALIQKLSAHGGHFGPNLGMVEAIIAMHYVFDSPKDKFVFDVSHQSYVHKMLTGRVDAFIDPEKYDDVSGYSEPSESEHDHFVIGHTSTSISLALGLAKGRDLCDGTYNVLAIIGDGSLSGGEALEGLNVAGSELKSNFIIIVNDNEMSIAENHGGLYDTLRELRESNGQSAHNIFKAMNLDYQYVANGNDIRSLIEAYQSIKDCSSPVVLHIHTLKGKGYTFAEKNKEQWHYSGPFDIATGHVNGATSADETWESITSHLLLDEIKKDHKVVVIAAGTPASMGFNAEYRLMAGDQYVDVGIAEETAVAMASGIAKSGGKPVFGTYSTFIQRCYDQLSQDLCINKNPATLLIAWGSVTGMNDVTHTCFYDIALMSNIPNLVYLAPTNCEEYEAMLRWSIHQTENPVAIRIPFGKIHHTHGEIMTDYSMLNRYETTHEGSQVAILGLGNFYHLGGEVCSMLLKHGIEATLVNPRYITGTDVALLEHLKENHQLVVTLEDGALDGGFGEMISRYYGVSCMKCLNFGVKKDFFDRFDLETFLEANHLSPSIIVTDILKALTNHE